MRLTLCGVTERWRRRRTGPDDALEPFSGFGRTGGVWRNPLPFLPPVRRRAPGPLPPAARVEGEDAFVDPFEEAPPEPERVRWRLPVPPPRSVVAPVIAVAGVCAIVAGLTGAFGHDRRSGAVAAPVPAVSGAVLPGGQAPAKGPKAPPKGPAAPGPQPPAPAVPAGSLGQVAVLTQGAAPGSADGLVDRIEAGGWDVTGRARFTGVVPSTTVYYPPGQEEAARRLAGQLGIDRVKPSFSGITRNKIAVIVVERGGTVRG